MKEKNNLKQEQTEFILALISTLIIEFIWTIIWLYSDGVTKLFDRNTNIDMIYYVFSMLICVIAFVILSSWGHRLFSNFHECKENKFREMIFETIFYTIFTICLSIIFLNTCNMQYVDSCYIPYIYNDKTKYLVILISLMMGVLLSGIIRRAAFSDEKSVNLLPLWIALALVAAWGVYQTNIFNDYYDTVHFDAYFTSVYRVMKLQPYTEVNTGVYGFYGLILAPFVKLLGGDIRACFIVLSGFTFSSILCYFYVLESLIRNFLLKICCGIVMISGFVSTISTIRVQIFPHRFIMAGFVLAYIAWTLKHKDSNLRKVISYVLVVLAMIWNFETGVATLLAVVGSSIVRELQTDEIKIIKVFLHIIRELLAIPIVFLLTYSIICLYNICVSGKIISINALLFPFINSSLIGDFGVRLNKSPSAWMMVLFLFIVLIAVVLNNTILCGKIGKNKEIVLFSTCAITVIIQMVYYVNRSDYVYLYIVLPLSAILMGYLAEMTILRGSFTNNHLGSGLLRAFSVTTITILVLLAISTIGKAFRVDELKSKNRDTSTLYEFTSNFSKWVPVDTLAFGIGMTEIYSILNWDTGYYGVDMAEFRFMIPEKRQEICDWLNETGDIVISQSTLDKWLLPYMDEGCIDVFFEKHNIVKSFEFKEEKYVYYSVK